ncbi:MAG: DUF2752 domain-containing protein [Pirellulaceae bacterium]|nr:DUF2752 domain-containing protein [Pirellulaceae bacterium]
MTEWSNGEKDPSVSLNRFSRWELYLYIAIVALGLVALAIVFWFPPLEHRFYPRCAFHDLTGLHCPGCGGFRAWHNLLNGQILSALRMNALAVTLLPGLVAWLFYQRFWFHKGDFWTLQASPRMHLLMAGLVIAFGFLRNIPLFPFNWLAP